MKAVLAVAIMAAVLGITVWMVTMGRRDYREMRASSDRNAPLVMVGKARLGGLLVVAPLFAFFWLDPPALTWVTTIYLVGVIVVLGWVLLRRRRT
jgi:hypothetical protein